MREQTEQQARFSFASLREKFLDALPYLVFFVLLFFTIYYLFGVADALLGIVFLFFSRAIIQDPGLSFANYRGAFAGSCSWASARASQDSTMCSSWS